MLLNIIHLPQRTDRLISLKKEIFDQGIMEYKIWQGVQDHTNHKRGIAIAHKQIIKWALENEMDYVTIAEDDIKFSGEHAFKYYSNRMIDLDFDIFLGGITYGTINTDNSVEDFAGLTLYTVKRKFFKDFLSTSETGDLDRNLAGKGKFIVCNPLVSTQHNGYSDNQKRIMEYDTINTSFQFYENL